VKKDLIVRAHELDLKIQADPISEEAVSTLGGSQENFALSSPYWTGDHAEQFSKY